VNRSGSTFLANVIDKSNDILSCPEGDILLNILCLYPNSIFNEKYYIPILEKEYRSNLKLKYWNLHKLDINYTLFGITCFDVFVSIIFHYKQKVKPGASNIVFKAESIFQYYNKLNHTFISKYKIILLVLIRDIRGIYESQKRTKFPGSNKYMSKNPVRTALFWNKFIKNVFELAHNKNVFLIKFEEMILQTELIIDNIKNFLKIERIDFNVQNDVYERLPESHKRIHNKINIYPPDITIIDKWVNNLKKHEIFILNFFCRRNLSILKYYPISFIKKKRLIILLMLALYMFEAIFVKLNKYLVYKLKTLYFKKLYFYI